MKKKESFLLKIKREISDFFYSISVFLHTKIFKKRELATNNAPISAEQIKKQKSIRKIKELLFIWSALLIPLINLAIFWVYGTISSFPIAFEHHFSDGTMRYDWFNFQYLFNALKEPGSIFLESLKNTIVYWLFNVGVLTPVSFLMGFFLYKKIWGYKVFRYVFYLPSIVSAVIIAAFFKYMVGPGGQVPIIVEKIFGKDGILLLADSDYAFGTLLFYNFFVGLCGDLLYWLAAFSRIPVDVVEAGKIDGLSVMGEFIYLTFPITWPFLATMLMLKFTGILSSGGAALLLTNGQYGTYDLNFYEYVLTISGSKASQGLSGAIGLLKGFLVLPVTLVVNHFVGKIEQVEF